MTRCRPDRHLGLNYCAEDCGCGGGVQIYCSCCYFIVTPEDADWEKWLDKIDEQAVVGRAEEKGQP